MTVDLNRYQEAVKKTDEAIGQVVSAIQGNASLGSNVDTNQALSASVSAAESLAREAASAVGASYVSSVANISLSGFDNPSKASYGKRQIQQRQDYIARLFSAYNGASGSSEKQQIVTEIGANIAELAGFIRALKEVYSYAFPAGPPKGEFTFGGWTADEKNEVLSAAREMLKLVREINARSQAK